MENNIDKMLSLGECIYKLEAISLKREDGEDKSVDFDFGTAFPTSLDSWRGVYAHLALGYSMSGYDDHQGGHFSSQSGESLLKEFKSAMGKTFTGWKGGEFTMDADTPVWVANRGNSGNTGIMDICDDGWRIVIITAYCEY